MILQRAHGPASTLSLPQTSHNYLQVVSTAEILFNDSTFALLPGQGAFVRAQVSVLGIEGLLEGGGDAGIVEVSRERRSVGREAGGGMNEGWGSRFREGLVTGFRCTQGLAGESLQIWSLSSLMHPHALLSALDGDQSGAIQCAKPCTTYRGQLHWGTGAPGPHHCWTV